MTHSTIYIATTTILRLSGLQDSDDVFQNAATVTLEALLKRDDDTVVTGISVPVAMPYIVASDGVYEAVLPSNLGVVAGEAYVATLKAISGILTSTWKETIRAKDARA